MFLGEGGTNSSKAMELCEFEKKAKKWYKSAARRSRTCLNRLARRLKTQRRRRRLERDFEEFVGVALRADVADADEGGRDS